MFRVSYSVVEGTRLFEVTLHVIGQTIFVPGVVLVDKIGMHPRCSVGCKDLSVCEILDLGFVFPVREEKRII